MRVFEVRDKSGRLIYLSDERFKHLLEHPEMQDKFALQWVEETLRNPLVLVDFDEEVKYYYRYYKNRKSMAKYLRVIVKYLNGEGFIIAAYFIEKIP